MAKRSRQYEQKVRGDTKRTRVGDQTRHSDRNDLSTRHKIRIDEVEESPMIMDGDIQAEAQARKDKEEFYVLWVRTFRPKFKGTIKEVADRRELYLSWFNKNYDDIFNKKQLKAVPGNKTPPDMANEIYDNIPWKGVEWDMSENMLFQLPVYHETQNLEEANQRTRELKESLASHSYILTLPITMWTLVSTLWGPTIQNPPIPPSTNATTELVNFFNSDRKEMMKKWKEAIGVWNDIFIIPLVKPDWQDINSAIPFSKYGAKPNEWPMTDRSGWPVITPKWILEQHYFFLPVSRDLAPWDEKIASVLRFINTDKGDIDDTTHLLLINYYNESWKPMLSFFRIDPTLSDGLNSHTSEYIDSPFWHKRVLMAATRALVIRLDIFENHSFVSFKIQGIVDQHKREAMERASKLFFDSNPIFGKLTSIEEMDVEILRGTPRMIHLIKGNNVTQEEDTPKWMGELIWFRPTITSKKLFLPVYEFWLKLINAKLLTGDIEETSQIQNFISIVLDQFKLELNKGRQNSKKTIEDQEIHQKETEQLVKEAKIKVDEQKIESDTLKKRLPKGPAYGSPTVETKWSKEFKRIWYTTSDHTNPFWGTEVSWPDINESPISPDKKALSFEEQVDLFSYLNPPPRLLQRGLLTNMDEFVSVFNLQYDAYRVWCESNVKIKDNVRYPSPGQKIKNFYGFDVLGDGGEALVNIYPNYAILDTTHLNESLWRKIPIIWTFLADELWGGKFWDWLLKTGQFIFKKVIEALGELVTGVSKLLPYIGGAAAILFGGYLLTVVATEKIKKLV